MQNCLVSNAILWYNDDSRFDPGRQAVRSSRRTEGGASIATRPQPDTQSTETLSQVAYDFVKVKITNLELKPGENLTDGQIASELEMSRTPVREAFRRLEQEGLLVSEARRGWKVYSLCLEDIYEIFEVIEVIDGLAARRAALCQDVDLRRTLSESLEHMRQAAEADDSDAWRAADHVLHQTVFDMAGNERAARIYYNLNDQWGRLKVGFVALAGRLQRSIGEHEAFVGCILAGDADEAERQIRIHIANLRDEVAHTLINLVLPFAGEGV